MREQNKLLVNKLLARISTVGILLLFVTKVSFAQCTTDLALGKAVTSSSVNANNYAYYATDGSTTTRWESAWSDPQWIMVDLGAKYPICTVNITWEDARGKDFLIQVSDDGTNWRTKATVTGNTSLTNSWSFSDTARYVRMYGTARVLTGYGYSIYTLEIMGTAPTTVCSNTNVAQSQPGYTSSVVGANSIANAFDNSTTTRWESVSSDPQYIYVDLGAQYDLCRVALTWEAAYGKDFTIDISTNGTTWTTAATITGNYIKNNSIAISGVARYVRMYGTARGTVYGYSLYDFAVYAMLPALSVTKLTDGAEPGTNGSFRLSLPTGITYSDDITVNYTVTGTATNGTDYINLPASAVIPAGSNYVDISYNTADDNIIEGDETIVVTITGGTSGTSTAYSTFPLSATDYAATSTISDDDNVADNKVLKITTTTTAAEPSTNGAFTVSLPTDYTAKEDVTVNYTIAGVSTATAGTDYSTLSGTVVLPANSNSVPITISVIDDKIIETTEWVQVALDGGTAGTLGTFAGIGNAQLYIADDDNTAANKVISIVSTGDAEEPSTNGSFKISLPTDITVSEDVMVNYTVTGTATAGADYATLAGTLTFPAGTNSIDVPVTVIDDNEIEGTETVIATLTGGTSATFGAFTGTTNATVNIADNDDVVLNRIITVTATTQAAEPGTNGEFTVSLPSGVTYPDAVTVNYTIAGTATSGDDYTALTGTATIPAGSNSATIPVVVKDDQIIEGNETIVVTLTSASSASFGTFTATNSATVTIADDEVMNVSFLAVGNAYESGSVGVAQLGFATGVTATEDVTVTYSLSGTATSGVDYTALTGTVIIPAGQNSGTIPLNVIDDNLYEGDENVTVTLANAFGTQLGAITVAGNATVTISDDDTPTLTIANTTDGAEPGTTGLFTVSLPTGVTSTTDITVPYTVTGTATSGDDYTALSGTVTIPAGSNSAVTNIIVHDDQLIEGNETVIVTLTDTTQTATVTITDNDLPTFSIVKITDAAEPSANGSFTVSYPANTTAVEDVTITYTVSGSATPGTDYTTLTGTVVIPAGENSITLPVNVIDNYLADGTRTVILTLVSGTDGINTFQPGTDYSATVNITDNDVANYQTWKVAGLPSNNVDGKIQPGEVITYTIFVRNTSNTAIGPLTITDKIPTNTNWESGGTLSSGVVSFSIASLAAGGVTEVTFQVKTYENLDGVTSINNTAHVSDGFNKLATYACDPQSATCDTVTIVPVRASKGDLTITKTVVGDGPFVIDDYITYNIVVKNTGLSSFTNLVIVDSLPYNLDLPFHTTTSKGTTSFSTSPRKVTWYVDELVPGDSIFITVTCRILSGEKITNTAYVYANEGEADYTNNTAINKEETSTRDLYFINAFRPGGTNNNKFIIVGIEKYPGSHLLVYSRWGNVVYESSSYNNDWTADNIPMGEYIYKVIVPKKTGKFTYTGTVLIIR